MERLGPIEPGPFEGKRRLGAVPGGVNAADPSGVVQDRGKEGKGG